VNDEMQDFELVIDCIKHLFTLLNGKLYNNSIKIHFSTIDLKKLPITK
jgi:hypothetical protein